MFFNQVKNADLRFVKIHPGTDISSLRVNNSQNIYLFHSLNTLDGEVKSN
jgi:hypothetical protein